MQTPRWHQRLTNFSNALAKLRDNVTFISTHYPNIDLADLDTGLEKGVPINDIFKQGLIQSFEFTHELAWNVMKDFATDQGMTEIRGSKDATRYAAQVNLIEDGHLWMQMIQSRNQSTHTYDEETANRILVEIIRRYMAAFLLFEQKMQEIKNAEPRDFAS